MYNNFIILGSCIGQYSDYGGNALGRGHEQRVVQAYPEVFLYIEHSEEILLVLKAEITVTRAEPHL